MPPYSAEDLVALLHQRFPATRGSLGTDSPIFSGGILDSFDLIELLAALEKLTGRRIRPGEVNLANFDTASRLAGLLNRKTQAPP